MAGSVVARRALRVPQITVYFWLIKALSTALGESTSDYLVHAIDPVIAVVMGFVGFVAALAVQFAMRRYSPWTYWFAVVMVGIFGTMAADVLHVKFHVPYAVSAIFYGMVLTAVFVTWQRCEHTLDVHSIDSFPREAFYWAAVVSTFALGTAVGDLTAITLNLGYLGSMFLFAGLIGLEHCPDDFVTDARVRKHDGVIRMQVEGRAGIFDHLDNQFVFESGLGKCNHIIHRHQVSRIDHPSMTAFIPRGAFGHATRQGNEGCHRECEEEYVFHIPPTVPLMRDRINNE